METNVKQLNEVEYELEINASPEDLAPEIDKALRAQRPHLSLKGFRQGKVPLHIVKKMVGREVSLEIVEKKIQEVYEAEVLEPGDYEVLGPPMLEGLDYDLDGPLHARIRFGVRPLFELQDLSGEQVTRLVYTASDEEVAEKIEDIRRQEADLVPVEDEGAGEEDYVVLDLQRLDDASGAAIVGEREEDVAFFLDDERLRDELREKLLGKQAGDTFRVELPHEGDDHEAPPSGLVDLAGHAHPAHAHTHAYQVTIKDVKRRELPELDEDFVDEVTKGQFDDVAAFREEVARQLEKTWQERSRDYLQGQIVERMLDLHPIPVPASVVETFLDGFIEDIKRRNDGELPEGLDVRAFREANRGEAEKQSRWMLVRDKVVEDEGLEVSDEELDTYFEKEAEGSEQLNADLLRRFYKQMDMLGQLQERLLSEKVYDVLAERFDVVEKDRETVERELEEKEGDAAPPAETPVSPLIISGE